MLTGRRDEGPAADAVSASAGSLADLYNAIFEAVPADDAALRDECFRIRYQVYCLERSFEDPSAKPDRRETDEYDASSRHGLLRYRKTGAVVGTIRVVLPDVGRGTAALPMYGVCAANGIAPERLPPLDRTTEISRFAISKEFRQRAGDESYGRAYDPGELDGRRVIPHMTLGLMGLAVRESRAAGADYICAIMEPTLIRLLSRVGIEWQPVGPLLEYHGLRQPSIARLGDVLAHVEAARPDVYDVISATSLGKARRLIHPGLLGDETADPPHRVEPAAKQSERRSATAAAREPRRQSAPLG
jgi:N-acyl amino acid synthase of PEP-CTERM/exosortase system